MKKNKKNKAILITSAVILIVLAGTAAVTHGWKNWGSPIAKKTTESSPPTGTVMDESNIGKPTGDDPWQEIEKLVDAYYGGDKQISYSGTMRLLDDNGQNQKLLEEYDFNYSYFKGQYYYKLGFMECVGKGKFLLVVNNTDKTIALSTVVPATKKQDGLMDFGKFKKVMQDSKADAKITQAGNEKIFTVNNLQDPTIQGYQVFYDPVSYRIHKLVVGMIRLSSLETGEIGTNDTTTTIPEENKVSNPSAFEVNGYSYVLEIIYEKANLVTMTNKGFNPENKFIRITGNHIELADAYKNYRLTN